MKDSSAHFYTLSTHDYVSFVTAEGRERNDQPSSTKGGKINPNFYFFSHFSFLSLPDGIYALLNKWKGESVQLVL